MIGVGSTLNNRYQLNKALGEGGFAHVYMATDLELGRQVAVKVLDQNWAKNKDLITRFRTEARAVAMLDHPNILTIYDFGVAYGSPYIVMPYISGGTFAARMKEGPFTLDEVGFYLDQIASALDYAHEHGIVHRDVKPTNLLMKPDGNLVLMDFGLAKLLQNVALEEQTAIVGTIAYMAPEQFYGLVSVASDIYVLGILLYQMLAGRLPFEGNTNQLLMAHLQLAPDSLVNQPGMRAVHPAVVQALDAVIKKVLAKHPTERYFTCKALCSAYYEALKADPRRVSRDYSRSRRPDFSETLLTDQPMATPLPSFVPLSSPDGGDFNAATLLAPSSSPRKKIMLKPPRLLVTTEPDHVFQASFDLTGETLTLGRASDNNLRIPVAIISRHQALLQRLNPTSQEPSYKIVQRKSTNSLLFEGKEILEKVLEHGDVIEIGQRGYTECIVKLTYQGPEYGFV